MPAHFMQQLFLVTNYLFFIPDMHIAPYLFTFCPN